MRALLFVAFLFMVGGIFMECAHACDAKETQGWTEAEPRVVFFLDTHGDHQRISGNREYRRFECDGKWRYRVIETGVRRKT